MPRRCSDSNAKCSTGCRPIDGRNWSTVAATRSAGDCCTRGTTRTSQLSVVRGVDPLMSERREALGLAGFAPFVGMGEAEVDGTVAAVDPDALLSYVRDVHARTADWFDGADLGVLDTVTDCVERSVGAGRDRTRRRRLAARHVDGQAGRMVRAVGVHRSRPHPRRRDGERPQPDGPQPVLTRRESVLSAPDVAARRLKQTGPRGWMG